MQLRLRNRIASRKKSESNHSDGTIRSNRRRKAQVLVTLAIVLPVLTGFVGLVLDTSIMLADHRNLQNACDTAATAAAMTIYKGGTSDAATAMATACVQLDNGLSNATVSVTTPPTSGSYSGNTSFVQVTTTRQVKTYFIQVLGSSSLQQISATSVAGAQAGTAGGAVVVLDPNPPGTTVDLSGLVSLSLTLPPLQLGGLEVLGLGQLKVNGAVLVNNEWGGVDQKGNLAGSGPAPPYGASCTPLVGLTSLAATDIRVVGGVDNPKYYGSNVASKPSPLRVGTLPVEDPYSSVPAPTIAADGVNVSGTTHGGVQVIGLPLISPPTVLTPGVYDWIEVISGKATFNPGVYIIRNVNPLTQVALNLAGGTVTAKGVTFYITNSTGYSAASGTPDNSDGNTVAPNPSLSTLIPSVVIANLLGSTYMPLADPSSPFDGLLIYQRRLDRRPIVIADVSLGLGNILTGGIYAKYAQVVFAANGTYNLTFAAGSIRFANLLTCTIASSHLLPPAMDIYLVQ